MLQHIDARFDALLVCMPFGPVFSPSLGLSLLQSSLTRAGLTSTVRYYSIRFAERIGQQPYSGIERGEHPPVVDLAGEWIFADALAPGGHGAAYVEHVLERREGWPAAPRAPRVSPATVRHVRAAREAVGPFLDECLEDLLAASPRVVGFTSVFQQHTASLALAARIKSVRPDITVVFGGANCESVMGAETVRCFPFVDAAVSGEGEVVFPDLVARVRDGRSFDDVPGVQTRATVTRTLSGAPPPPRPVSMDDLPYPDFSDYMRQFDASHLSRRWRPTFPFETSRGCWWGAKHHCTFCGLNGSTMAFRSKSPERAMDELVALTSAHPGCEVQVVDTILDMQYFKTFLPALARRGPLASLLYETKANLRKDQVRLLRDAGVSAIQPGIESLSDRVLQGMRKGVTALQNIQLLKWCKELGVEPLWNILWGFPGDSAADYRAMAELAGALVHLPPPSACLRVRLDRFSPNFDEAEARGFANVRPLAPYDYIYDLPDASRRRLAYFFQFEYADGRDRGRDAQPLVRALARWKRQHASADLFSIDVNGRLLVWDFRPGADAVLHDLSGLDRLLCQACDQVAEGGALIALAATHGHADATEVRRRLDRLVAARVLCTIDGKYLTLAIPVGDYQPPAHITARLFRELRGGVRTPAGMSIRVDGPLPRTRFGTAQFETGPDGSVLVRSVVRGPA